MALDGALLLGGVAGAALLAGPPRAMDSRGCVAGAPHRTLAVVVDTSDRLIVGQPRESREAIDEALTPLRRGDRAAVVEMSGAAPTEATPLVDACLPGEDTNVERNRLRDRIWAPIDTRLTALAGRPAAETSPLIETLLFLASDRQFNGPTSRLSVLMLTDGLQNSPLASAYSRRGSAFPPASGLPLRGVRVTLFILRNPRDAGLQPGGTAALAAWLKAAGAAVTFDPPPWMSVPPAPRRA